MTTPPRDDKVEHPRFAFEIQNESHDQIGEVLACEVVDYVSQYGSVSHHCSAIEKLRTCL
jgi:hypothetical protein